jgi:hypothetical protein
MAICLFKIMNLENYEIIQEFDVKQIMRDGVKSYLIFIDLKVNLNFL